MTLITMFYTRVEATERLGWTFQCNGIASVLAGFISYGLAHVSAKAHPRPWQWLMIVIAILSADPNRRRLAHAIMAEVGTDPAQWVPEYRRRFREAEQ